MIERFINYCEAGDSMVFHLEDQYHGGDNIIIRITANYSCNFLLSDMGNAEHIAESTSGAISVDDTIKARSNTGGGVVFVDDIMIKKIPADLHTINNINEFIKSCKQYNNLLNEYSSII